MPEYFDCEIPVARRKPKDLRIHRVVRRDVWSDYISKQMVANETYVCVYSYLNYANMVDTESLRRQQKFSAIEIPDPFGLRAFHLKYSLNKKYRWELDEELSENIISYQVNVHIFSTFYLSQMALLR
ncbi:unnamed protein product [Toxocara canis]|uniref:Myotubularin phosphatase domain-containing protein n=1 Tax=Toxocara canis TaxID=6265 RepID=A0A183U1Z0_TOXCA|nr:unnamed protein product [Toxocara canis]